MADIRVSDVKQMTPGRAALREIAERIKAASTGFSLPPHWFEDVQRLADGVLVIAAPLLEKCRECGGGFTDDSNGGLVRCDACHGKGSVERADIAAIRKRFAKAPHYSGCPALGRWPKFIADPTKCDCWKSTFGLDALLDLIAAQAREIERLKEQ